MHKSTLQRKKSKDGSIADSKKSKKDRIMQGLTVDDMEKSLQLMEQGGDLRSALNESTMSKKLALKKSKQKMKGKVKVRLDRQATKAGRIFGVDDPFEKPLVEPDGMSGSAQEGGPKSLKTKSIRSKSKAGDGSTVSSVGKKLKRRERSVAQNEGNNQKKTTNVSTGSQEK